MNAGSGKQLSFAFGEISPILHNKSDSALFTMGLKKAYNGIVRTTGGFSNRPGTLLFKTDVALPQTDLKKGYRLFVYTEPSDGKQYYIVVYKTIPGIFAGGFPQSPVLPFTIYDEDGVLVPLVNSAFAYGASSYGADIDLDSVEFKRIRGRIIFNFRVTPLGAGFWEDITHYAIVVDKEPTQFKAVSIPLLNPGREGAPASEILGALTTFYLTSGLQPQPVSYKIYQELYDGSEFPWQEGDYVLGMPSSSATNQLVGIDINAAPNVKQYNVYRAASINLAGTAKPAGAYGLVGRIPADSTITENGDALITADMLNTPPRDISIAMYMLPENIKKIFYSKERYLVVLKDGAFEEGSIAASKLGSNFWWARGLAPTELDSFVFNLDADNTEQCDIRAIADIENTLVMTSEMTYSVRGSQGGVISYANVNPVAVFNEGIAKDLQPACLANQVFFLNADRSKIVSLKASDADSYSYVPDNVSQISAHLLKKRNVKRITVTKGADTIVWCLTAEGLLISITYDEASNVKGFARHDVGAFIEDFSVVKMTNDPLGQSPEFSEMVQTISLLVVRDGVRMIENMAVRDDDDAKNFLYADSSVRFGGQFNTPAMVLKITPDGGGSDYSAGKQLLITDEDSTGFFGTNEPGAIDVYLADGSFIRITTLITTSNTLIGICDYDIPAEIQNVDLAKYIFPVKIVTGLTHLAGQEVSVFAEGMVLSSPWNKATQLPVMEVSMSGELDLGDFYEWGYVGLPYKYVAQTLRLEAADSRTFTDKGKLINSAGVAVESTLGGLLMQDVDAEIIPENVGYLAYQRDSNMYSAQEPVTDTFDNATFPAGWDMQGSVGIIQVDPLPITVAAVYPKGVIGG